MQDLTGKTIGGYQIVEQIGRGGMATVFRAYQPSLDRDVALKVLPPYFAEQDETFLERFKREARAIARLRHPNILMVMDFGREEDLSYIVMEYVTAGTLKDRLQEPIDLKGIYELTSQIASALQYAHDQGVVHRDVKPSNIMLPKPDWALLTDFGLARMVGGSFLTQSGMTVGTPAYMSPEQGSGKPVDHRCDIYSLGVMLYEMVVGEVPYTAETPMAVVVKHIVDPLPMPRAKNPTIPEELQKVILKSLAKNPDDRFQQISEIPQALVQIVEAYPGWSAGEVKEVNAVRAPHIDQPETQIIDEEALDADLADAPTVGGLPGGEQTEAALPVEEHEEQPEQESAPAPVSGTAAGVPKPSAKKKRRLWPFIAGGVVVLAMLGLFLANLIFSTLADNSENQGSLPPVAEEQLSDEIENEPPEESVQRVVDLVQRGELERANQVLKIAIARRPELWGVLTNRVELLESKGDYETAARLLSLGLGANPDVPAELYTWQGGLFMSAGMPLEANYAFRDALTREPFLVDAHDGLVNSAIAAEIAPDAIGFLENLKSKFPEEFQIYTSLGDLYDFDGQTEQALAHYERAMEMEPNDPWTLVQAAQVYFYSGSPRKAQDLAAQAVDIGQGDPVVLGQTGFLYLSMEDFEQAFVVFEQAHQLDKDDTWNALGLAESIYYSGRDKGQAAELLRFAEMRGKEQQDAWLLNDLGWFYVNIGDCENAVRIFNEVEAFAPGLTDARDGLGACN